MVVIVVGINAEVGGYGDDDDDDEEEEE